MNHDCPCCLLDFPARSVSRSNQAGKSSRQHGQSWFIRLLRMLNVLLVVERKNKRLVAMIGDETLKKYFQRKYIHTYMEEMPRKVKKFSRKKFQTAKKNENRLL